VVGTQRNDRDQGPPSLTNPESHRQTARVYRGWLRDIKRHETARNGTHPHTGLARIGTHWHESQRQVAMLLSQIFCKNDPQQRAAGSSLIPAREAHPQSFRWSCDASRNLPLGLTKTGTAMDFRRASGYGCTVDQSARVGAFYPACRTRKGGKHNCTKVYKCTNTASVSGEPRSAEERGRPAEYDIPAQLRFAAK
jgi:hypothetical protein